MEFLVGRIFVDPTLPDLSPQERNAWYFFLLFYFERSLLKLIPKKKKKKKMIVISQLLKHWLVSIKLIMKVLD